MSRNRAYDTASKAAKLVWLLLGLALAAGILMLLIVSMTIRGVREEQAQREAVLKKLTSSVQDLGHELSQGEVAVLRALEGRPGAAEDGQWIGRARQALRSMQSLVSDGDIPIDLAPAAGHLARLDDLRRRCADWRAALLTAEEQRANLKQDADALLKQLRETVEAAEGNQRLNRAILMSGYRQSSGNDADVIGREILKGIGAEADLTAARRELASLDLLCERLYHLEEPRLRPDIQDNRILPTLSRLYRRFAALHDTEAIDAPDVTSSIERLEGILFGPAADPAPAEAAGGLTAAVLDRLRLIEEGAVLRVEAAAGFRAIDDAREDLTDAAKGFARQVSHTTERAFGRAWFSMFGLFVLTAAAFGMGGYRTVRAIRAQVAAVEAANEELAESTAALRQSNQQLQGEIAERERAEAALDREEERFHLIVQHLSDTVWVLDPDFTIKYATPSCRDVLGYSPDQIIGRRGIDFVHPDDLAAAADAFEEVLRKENPNMPTEFRFKHADGHWVDLEAVASNMLGFPSVDGIVLTSRDISERKRADEERRRLEGQVLRSQKMESLSVMAASIAHNFNNLLQAVLSHIDLAQDPPPDFDVESALNDARSAALRASELSGLMLTYVGQGEDSREPIHISGLVCKLKGLIEAAIPATTQRVFELADDLRPIQGDPGQIEQVVMNLVSNATESIGKQRGTVTVSTGTCDGIIGHQRDCLVVEEMPDGPCVFLRVADTGCGMGSDIAARVFEPYFTTKFTGRGLGLAVVLGIVRSHGGAIVVDSKPGQGTVVSVIFPTVDTVPKRVKSVTATARWEAGGTILLADDEVAVLRATGLMLERLGFDVIQAADGQEAVDRFLESSDTIDCAILDMTMPLLDGGDVLKRIREVRSDLPAILVSGYDRSRAQEQLDNADWAAFIHKPYSMDALRRALHAALQNQQERR